MVVNSPRCGELKIQRINSDSGYIATIRFTSSRFTQSASGGYVKLELLDSINSMHKSPECLTPNKRILRFLNVSSFCGVCGALIEQGKGLLKSLCFTFHPEW